MEEAGVSDIDQFVATHYHEDHYGGIDDLVNMGVSVGHASDRGDKDFLPSSKLSEKTYKDYQAAFGERATHLMRGEDNSKRMLGCLRCHRWQQFWDAPGPPQDNRPLAAGALGELCWRLY